MEAIYSNERTIIQPEFKIPKEFKQNEKNLYLGLDLLRKIKAESTPLCIFDPQYRGVLDYLSYGNEGERQKKRNQLRQMPDEEIKLFIREMDSILIPTGHLFLWVDKFHLCSGVSHWFSNTELNIVDLITWNKQRMGMGYRSRRTGEYLLILQKLPQRVKGVWTLHNIPDVWEEKVTREYPHAKPIRLQSLLIKAVTNVGDTVIDPAAGSYSVLQACKPIGRNFLGCDVEG